MCNQRQNPSPQRDRGEYPNKERRRGGRAGGRTGLGGSMSVIARLLCACVAWSRTPWRMRQLRSQLETFALYSIHQEGRISMMHGQRTHGDICPLAPKRQRLHVPCPQMPLARHALHVCRLKSVHAQPAWQRGSGAGLGGAMDHPSTPHHRLHEAKQGKAKARPSHTKSHEKKSTRWNIQTA